MNDINPNLIILLRKLVSDAELAQKFSSCKTLDEFYDFGFKITTGYTKDELHEFLISLSKLTFREENNKIILKEDLEKISGGNGMNDIAKKYLSGILAVLSTVSTASLTDFNAVDTKPNDSTTAHKAIQKVSNASKESKWGKWVEDISVGAAAGAVVGAAVYYALSLPNEANLLGLPNMRYSCYINATIQQLYSLREFREKIMADTSDDKKVRAIKNLFSLISRGNRIKISEISESICDLGYEDQQEDATEFLIHDLESLLDKYDMEHIISEPLKISDVKEGTSLVELLKHGGGTDTNLVNQRIRELDPETKDWKNDNPGWAHKRTEFLESSKNKNPEEFNFPSMIQPVKGQFGVLISRTLRTFKGKEMVESKVKKAVFVPDKMQKNGSDYYLTGAMVHVGPKMSSGHYYSYKKNAKGQWLCYNDENVSIEEEKDVKYNIEHNGVLFIYTALPEAK